ncbi:hypothetical protein HS088_TW14G00535 [Tripterygium wilfordii]|uniref:VQ domain-containing protein n=1 Tax=Tripterygium wilfordii TaxID=458696 RepID=A0A7J7CQK0_TRIWF|nr:VQ motif-containing protein 25 [Tripterygium wilfordii]KAF5736393.1 hypothetical protein HS088_TW14G00535 [Tripterygium wilfordii]
MEGKEVMLKRNTNSNTADPITPYSSLSLHKNSHAISKFKQQKQVVIPKIRIIHIFAPQVIKTDVSNFRELVHRLTGKPDHQQKAHAKPITKKMKKRRNSTAISAPKRDTVVKPSAANMTSTLQHQDHEIHWGCGDQDSSSTSTTTAGGFLDDFDLFCLSDHFNY